MAARRILAGGIAQESHSFNPILTGRDSFTITEGAEAVRRARGTNSTLGGIIAAAEAAGAEVTVPVMFRAQSGGPVEDAVFAEVKAAMLDAARKGNFDAIALPLHGGMLTPALHDPEGVLIQELRAIVGPAVPITAAFDLHAHVTPATLNACDVLAGYLTNPHADQGATGRRAGDAAFAMLDGRLDPVLAWAHLPMLTLGNDRTDEAPLQGLHARARAAVEAGKVYDTSIFNAQQFLDVPGLGQVVMAYGNGRSEEAEVLVAALAAELWAAREALIGTYPGLEECLARAVAGTPRPLILGDQGDRVAAGAPGDSTVTLHALLNLGTEIPAAVPITDAEGVARCRAAGVGAAVTVTVGGRYSTAAPPVTLTGEVVAAGEGASLVYAGPAEKGQRAHVGPYAVLRAGKLTVVLTAFPYAYIDPEYYRAMGVEPAKQRVVITRSGYHFTLNYAAIGECITVDTPGMSSYRVAELPFTVARPFYPLDDLDVTPQVRLRRR
ncbi:M81 family peptidase [Roseomonas sp. M0104]|uniref:M81 family peptidase n=1 Tax=Teichococcus coralli TaxID=2545983 RepID=A0A845BN15_9PROT|nr:M81 family metallopeptidase [Pseudoroseomonas coralli]MXP64799.1 M81 family peptidase [Pseudoroseomonas coralli]